MSTQESRDDELRDTALHEEIELVGQLVVAATATSTRLSLAEIDRLLGVTGSGACPSATADPSAAPDAADQ